MRRRLKLSLIIGFVISLGLHISSAILTALFPYPDSPQTPPLFFFFVLEVGWVISGEPWPMFRLWQEIIAVAINGILFSILAFSFSLVWNWSRRAT
jgi:mannose/fructose/N-acetylgalactosamine-specific phosphotransferase system component IIC